MPQRRTAVRNLAYASAIAQAAMPEGAVAEAFEDSCAGGNTRLDWTCDPKLERGAVRGRSVKGAPDGAGGVITDWVDVDSACSCRTPRRGRRGGAACR